VKVILDALVKLEVLYLFSTPSKKIDLIVEEICNGTKVQLISCLSESSAIESCMSYQQVSGKNSAVLIDAEFTPANFFDTIEKAKFLELRIIFILVGSFNKYFASAIKETDLILNETDLATPLEFGLKPSPRICLVSSRMAELKVNSEAQSSAATAEIGPKASVVPERLTLLLDMIDELLTQSPNSILIPDAGSARKIVLSNFNKINYHTTPGLTAMGWALRALRGITLGCPDRLPIVLIGDGSMMLGASALAHFVKFRTPCVIILLINGQLGNRSKDSLIGKSSVLPKVDWQMFVEALGVAYAPTEGATNKKFIKGLLRRIKEERRPVVIPVDIGGETEYIYDLKTGVLELDRP
jgi:thiamine pyrophosphate-dependent acetolactate synthase large subunit-like protein